MTFSDWLCLVLVLLPWCVVWFTARSMFNDWKKEDE